MSDLIAFLRARLDEDEAAAKAAHLGPWDLETEVGGFGPVAYVLMPLPPHKGARTGLTRYIPLGTQDADTAAHIARHDPARVLREVEAHRAILARHAATRGSFQLICPVCWTIGRIDGADLEGDPWPCVTVRHLAAVYSDHPDYDPEWAA